jgi:alkanesulfonate monooxygenase SsuD/methylene tetrahydromethanopterin reductase-like flavin-dependent oxidoreductase (luciferase family)
MRAAGGWLRRFRCSRPGLDRVLNTTYYAHVFDGCQGAGWVSPDHLGHASYGLIRPCPNALNRGMEMCCMKFGAMFLLAKPEGRTDSQVYSEALEQIELADRLGFDSVWLAEHHFVDYGICPSTLSLAVAAAGRTSRVRIGTGVRILALDHPVRVAEEAAVVDLLSGGRLEFGIGAGYQKAEFAGYGVPFHERRDRMRANIKTIVEIWEGKPLTANPYHPELPDELTIHPMPIQDPFPPIWVAAWSKDSIEWAARNGWPFMVSFVENTEQIQENLAIYEAARLEAGQPPLRDVAVARNTYVAEDGEDVKASTEPALEHFLDQLRGKGVFSKGKLIAPDDVNYDYLRSSGAWVLEDEAGTVERLKLMESEMGVSYYLGVFAFGSLPHDKVVRSMERFAERVMPAFK